jgi:hypothetical protein
VTSHESVESPSAYGTEAQGRGCRQSRASQGDEGCGHICQRAARHGRGVQKLRCEGVRFPLSSSVSLSNPFSAPSGVFKRSAEKLAAAVKAAKPTATVVINEDKVCGPLERATKAVSNTTTHSTRPPAASAPEGRLRSESWRHHHRVPDGALPASLAFLFCCHTERRFVARLHFFLVATQNLPRPFTKLRELDIDEVAAKVVKAL